MALIRPIPETSSGINTTGFNTTTSVSCSIGDLVAVSAFHTGSHASVTGGDLVGSWTERDVGGSTFLGCGMIRATATTVSVSASLSYMAVITTS